MSRGNLKQMDKSEKKKNRFSRNLMKSMQRSVWRKIVQKVYSMIEMDLQKNQKLQLKTEIEKSKQKFLRMWKILNSSINIPVFVYKTEFGLGFYLDILFCWTWDLAETIIIIIIIIIFIIAFIEKNGLIQNTWALGNNSITNFLINKQQIMQ